MQLNRVLVIFTLNHIDLAQGFVIDLDGMLQEQEQYRKFLHDNYGAVVTRFKIMGKLDIAERRLPQDGAINFKIEGKVVDLRCVYFTDC